jgi:hypothetical protein
LGKLIYSMITSLDGFVSDPGGNSGWGAPDEEVHAFINQRSRSIGTYLYGRRMYETMVYWETAHACRSEIHLRTINPIEPGLRHCPAPPAHHQGIRLPPCRDRDGAQTAGARPYPVACGERTPAAQVYCCMPMVISPQPGTPNDQFQGRRAVARVTAGADHGEDSARSGMMRTTVHGLTQ